MIRRQGIIYTSRISFSLAETAACLHANWNELKNGVHSVKRDELDVKGEGWRMDYFPSTGSPAAVFALFFPSRGTVPEIALCEVCELWHCRILTVDVDQCVPHKRLWAGFFTRERAQKVYLNKVRMDLLRLVENMKRKDDT